MAQQNIYSYDFLAKGGERDRLCSFSKRNAEIRDKILDEAREKVFFDMDNTVNANSTRRAAEKAILYYISVGDIAKISEMLEQNADGSVNINAGEENIIGDISEDLRSQALGIFISGITLYTRAAIDGGLPENIAYNLSDVYIKTGMSLNDHRHIDNLVACALYDFTYEVYKYKYKDCSMIVKKCCEYINRHLHDEITLKMLSDVSERSANYISDLFFKELNIRPTDYIRKTKLSYACHVLELAGLSVSAVSDLLAFPSTSSFITYFKKEYGMTPLQYKKMIKS